MNPTLYEERKHTIRSFYRTLRKMPTYDECAKLFHLRSKGSLHKYVRRFIADGFLMKGKTGTLIPTEKLYGMKVLDNTKTQFPPQNEEEWLETLNIEEYLVNNPSSTYLFKIKGNAMPEAGIFEGDFVLIDRSKTTKKGDIVLTRLKNQWVLTKMGKPEYKNAAVVIGVIRKYGQ